MALSGHGIGQASDLYNLVSPKDLVEAARPLECHLGFYIRQGESMPLLPAPAQIDNQEKPGVDQEG